MSALDEEIDWSIKKYKKKEKKKTQGPYAVAYPGGCIACACTPGGSKRGTKKEGQKRRKQEKGERKGVPKKERREGKENMQKKRKRGKKSKENRI